MKRVMFVLLLAMAIAPSAWAQSWPNEPAGSNLILDCNFDTARCGGALYDVYGGSHTSTLPSTPLSQPNVFESLLPGTSTGGGAQVGKAFDPPLSEFYFGTWWKMNAGFAGFPSGINKLFFLISPYHGNTYYYFGAYGTPSDSSFAFYFETNDTKVDNSHLPNSYGGLVHFGNGCQVRRDTWYRVEAHIKRSSTATSRDGIFRWWINGILCGNYTNANFPDGIGYWEINHTWDGGTQNTGWKTGDWMHWFDHLRLSAPNGGGNTPKGDTTPPAAPTSLRAQ